MHDALEEVLILQTDYSSANTPEMQRRGEIIRTELRQEIEAHLVALRDLSGISDLRYQGKDGMGLKTEIPWGRLYSEERSPRATSGWYLVYLFSSQGDRVFLSVNQGTTRWDGVGFPRQPESDILARSTWARGVVSSLPEAAGWQAAIALDGQHSPLGAGYELGNVLAREYALDSIPDDDQLLDDLRTGVVLLAALYAATDEGLAVPGDSPELADLEWAIDLAAGRRRARRGPRLTAAERKAIELRAVEVVTTHLTSLGYAVKDVGATHSYDLEATLNGEKVFVEVKGTTSNGSDVILTRNEVVLHQSEYPHNALGIVHSITLNRKVSPPSASGGVLAYTQPWMLDPEKLAPIAYRYATGL